MSWLSFILELITMASLGLVVYVLLRALPRVSDRDVTPQPSGQSSHWFIEYLERVDEWLLSFVEKLLRRIRVFTLKLDNVVSAKLHRFKREGAKETGFPAESPKANNSSTEPPVSG